MKIEMNRTDQMMNIINPTKYMMFQNSLPERQLWPYFGSQFGNQSWEASD